MKYVAAELTTAIDKIPMGERRRFFKTALDLLDTCWCSVQIVGLCAGASPNDVVEAPGLVKAPQLSPKERKRQNLAKKIVKTRSLVGWILEEKAGGDRV